MAFSSSQFFFTSPKFTTNHQSSSSQSTNFSPFNFSKSHSSKISANFATAERTTSTTRITTTHSSLYDVLGIQIGADTVEIKAAYRKLARVLHPDVGNHDSSADEFIKVHSAYATLSDPGKRADYDRTLFGRHVAVRSSSPAGYTGRRWETDQCW